MNIMFYAWGLGKGGAERVLSVLSNNLIKNNKVSIVINESKTCMYELDRRIKIIELDTKQIM